MAIVTGDRYLAALARHLDLHSAALLDPSSPLPLKLNPAGLHYLHSRLAALRELELLLASAPLDYLRAYVADLGDHRALERLRRLLRLLPSIKLISTLPAPLRDPTPLSLLPFARLRSLELRGCDLSTSPPRGLLQLRHSLERLVCLNSTDALRHVFASRMTEIEESSPVWDRLSFVSCACNGLEFMDESLRLLPVVETLDLSRNRFANVDNLRKCTRLRNLDLEFNHLRTIACLSEVSCPIVKLVLRNNALNKLRGLENLKSVEGLDLSYNIISSFSELEILAKLPSLQSLWLEGNPICCARWHRARVFSYFPRPEKLKLDGKGICTREYWERHVIFTNRQKQKQKQPAGYGFYLPAKDGTEDEGSPYAKKKNYSRLASIEDDEQRRSSSSGVVDQESALCDSQSLRKDENAISDGDSEIVSLMNKVEHVRKEQSDLWLREFKEWLDQNSDTVDGSQCRGFNLGPIKDKYVKKRKGQKHFRKNTTNITDISQVSEGESSSSFLESDMSLRGTCVGVRGNRYTNCKDISELPVSGSSSIVGVNPERGQLKVLSKFLQTLSPLEVNGRYNHSSTCEGSDQIHQEISPAPLTAIDEIIGSRTFSIHPGSPPHYQQDILRRRLYLEEELLQLSASSLSVTSSDSDSSCSSDYSCGYHISDSELDDSLIQDSTEQATNDHSGNHHEGLEEKCLNEKHSPEYCAGSEYLLPNQSKLFSTCDNLDDNSCCENDHVVEQVVKGTENRKGKDKPKKIIVPLMENFVVCNAGTEIQNSNRTLYTCDADMDRIADANYVNYASDTCEQATILSHNWKVKNSSTSEAHNSRMKNKSDYLEPKQDDTVREFFNVVVADSGTSETCQELVECGCIFELGLGFQESEVALLRSSKNNLCIIFLDTEADGQEVIFKVLGCHKLEELKEVVVGLGQQALRVYTEDDATYLFLPRTVEKFNNLLCLLQLCDSTTFSSGCSLQSWEQVQVELLEKCVRRSLKMGIFFYSLLLFCHYRCDEGETWLPRSLFVIEGDILVCCENLVKFGSFADDFGSSPPYYSLDSCCSIQKILQMVRENNDPRCLTLTMDHVTYGNVCLDMIVKRRQTDKKKRQVLVWKLKWFSEDTLLKFVSLLKAIYSGLTSSPLPVKCIT